MKRISPYAARSDEERRRNLAALGTRWQEATPPPETPAQAYARGYDRGYRDGKAAGRLFGWIWWGWK